MTLLIECWRTRRSSEVGWGRLKKEREILEKEKEQFKELMEKEKAKLKLSKQNRAEKNRTLFERERSIHKCEDRLTEKSSEDESRLRRANFDSLIHERNQERGELEREAHAKWFEKENEIPAVGENNQEKFRNEDKIFSNANEDKNESLLASSEGYLMEVASKTVLAEKGKRETATRKSLKKEKKPKETMTGDHEWVLDRAFFLVTNPWRLQAQMR